MLPGTLTNLGSINCTNCMLSLLGNFSTPRIICAAISRCFLITCLHELQNFKGNYCCRFLVNNIENCLALLVRPDFCRNLWEAVFFRAISRSRVSRLFSRLPHQRSSYGGIHNRVSTLLSRSSCVRSS